MYLPLWLFVSLHGSSAELPCRLPALSSPHRVFLQVSGPNKILIVLLKALVNFDQMRFLLMIWMPILLISFCWIPNHGLGPREVWFVYDLREESEDRLFKHGVHHSKCRPPWLSIPRPPTSLFRRINLELVHIHLQLNMLLDPLYHLFHVNRWSQREGLAEQRI